MLQIKQDVRGLLTNTHDLGVGVVVDEELDALFRDGILDNSHETLYFGL